MQETYNGKIFGVGQFAGIVNKALGGVMTYRRELKLIDPNFRSRIMLAVTQVNGCKYCSYLHTKQALASGSTEQEIADLLDGNLGDADREEHLAFVFAQHYADSSGNYDGAAYQRVCDYYGDDKAAGILTAVKLIMMGNAHGGAMSLLIDRFKGKRNKESTFLSEIAIFLGLIVLIPVLFIKNLFARSK
ncbi:MAG: carboxymuconolactone decarboxylase family protein [Bacteroidales bacterium]|jgi:AhpD family alkylhydroperoxidase|nr:carboxymuconolactone decarboxylase family protein [Bacteroidales bacterium]